MANFSRVGLLATACGTLLMLAACAREDHDEMSWARAALERNSGIEVVAADQQSRTFTVRIKDTGELRMVRVGDVIAAPAPAARSAAAPEGTASQAQAPAAPNGAPIPVSTSAPPSATESAEGSAPSQTAAADTAPSAQPSSILPQTARSADSTPGKVLESGPGYSIKAAAPEAPISAGRVRETSVTSAALERRHEPIVCQGARLLHIDNRNLAFDGDAVSAEDGCEIHITNSHISAGGVGVLARAANVHIDNSLIEGNQASIDASQGAQVYFASSRFRGLSRRLDSAAFHDLGGNVWD
jgi:hypothetical protein